MKTFITLSILASVLLSCNKKKTAPASENPQVVSVTQNFGPYGKISSWICIGGDSLFAEKLTLTYFYTEKALPCNICYYQQSYSLWNDFAYTFSVSECVTLKDTIIIKDVDTGKKSIFKLEK